MLKKGLLKYLPWAICGLAAVYLFYYGLTNLIAGSDMIYANHLQNAKILLTCHPNLPFIRIATSLLRVQYLDAINFQAIIYTFILFIKGLGIIEIIYLIIIVAQFYLFAVREEKIFTIFMLGTTLVNTLFIVELIVTMFGALKVFLYANLNIYDVLGKYGTFYIVLGAFSMLISLGLLLYLILTHFFKKQMSN